MFLAMSHIYRGTAVECASMYAGWAAGTVADEYILQAPDLLNVVSTVTIGGRSERTVQVYTRRAGWQPRFSFPGYFLGQR